MTRRTLAWYVAAALLVAVVAGLYWFTPWKAFTTTTVRDALPSVAVSRGSASAAAGQPAVLASGSFLGHAHPTTGQVQLVRLADGRRQLIIIGLSTSDGPDVRVWLSDQPVPGSGEPYNIYTRGRHVDLGGLRGNAGDLVYDIPADVELRGLTSVDLWCVRFSVSFGAAELRSA